MTPATRTSPVVTIPLAPPKPTQPAGHRTSPRTEIDLSWHDNAGHQADGYQILRAVNHGGFIQVATLPATSRTPPATYTWADTNLTPGHILRVSHRRLQRLRQQRLRRHQRHDDHSAADESQCSYCQQWHKSEPGRHRREQLSVTTSIAARARGERALRPSRPVSQARLTWISSALPGVRYYYTVTAVNQNITPLPSESAPSKETYQDVPSAPTSLTASAGNQSIALTWVGSAGATGYNVYRGTGAGGEGTTPFATGITTTSFTDSPVASGTTYYYFVTAVNSIGESAGSAEASATTTPVISFSGGFASSQNLLTLNGAAAVSDSSLQLTDGQPDEAASAFFSTPVNVAQFSTQFTFQLTNANADGFTFTIQNDKKTALGPAGGGLGYGPDTAGGSGGIPNSVAVKFDLYSNDGEGPDSTGLYTDGAAPTNMGSIDLSSTGINFHNGDVFQANLSYNGSTLTETLTDTQTNATVTETYTVDIGQTVGSSTAYVGFTAGTGGDTATQDILTWTYSSGSQAPTGRVIWWRRRAGQRLA